MLYACAPRCYAAARGIPAKAQTLAEN